MRLIITFIIIAALFLLLSLGCGGASKSADKAVFSKSTSGRDYSSERASAEAPQLPAPEQQVAQDMAEKNEQGIESKPQEEGIKDQASGYRPKSEAFEVERYRDEQAESGLATPAAPPAAEPSPGGGGFGGGLSGESQKVKEESDGQLKGLMNRAVSEEDKKTVLDESAEKPSTKEELSLSQFRIRSQFPEVLYFMPRFGTDPNNGRASFAFPAGDSITEYLLRVQASTKSGEWGTGETSFKTYQPFFIDFDPPSTIHEGDTINLSVAIFNYTAKTVSVDMNFAAGANMRLDKPKPANITVQPQKVIEYPLSLTAIKTGESSIQITAFGAGVQDAILRKIKVLPAAPELTYSQNGTLKEGTNQVEILLPADAVALPGDFRMRVFSHPSIASLNLLRQLDDSPHASLSRSLAMLVASGFTWDELDKNALLTDDLRRELQDSVDKSWARVLAFRSRDGFAFFPGIAHDPVADLITLDALQLVNKNLVYDENLISLLEDSVAEYFKNAATPLADRLYSASLLLEIGYHDQTIRSLSMELIRQPLVKNSADPLIIGLSLRCSMALGIAPDPGKTDKLLENSTKPIQAYQQLASSPSSLNQLGSSSIPGIINFLHSIEHSKIRLSSNDKSAASKMVASLRQTIYDGTLDPLHRILAIVAVSKSADENKISAKLGIITVNNISPERSKNSFLQEFELDLKPGRNILEISTSDQFSSYQIMGRYFAKPTSQEFDGDVEFKIPNQLKPDNVFSAELTISSATVTNQGSVIITLPLPPGVKIIESPRALAKRLKASYAEIRKDKIILYFENKNLKIPVRASIPMKAEFTGNFFLPPPSVENNSKMLEQPAGQGSRVTWS